jgi:hypothetical protein
MYENFAYHVELLTQFVREGGALVGRSQSFREGSSSSVHGGKVFMDFVNRRQSSLRNVRLAHDKSDALSNSLPNYSRQISL